MNVSNIQELTINQSEISIRNTPNDQNSAVTQLFQEAVSSSSSTNDVNSSMRSSPAKINLRQLKFTYVYSDAPEYEVDKNNRLIDFIQHRLDGPLNLTKISFTTFLEIINEVHKIISDDTDVSNRLARSMMFNQDYALLVALNYETAAAEVPALHALAVGNELDRSLYLKASGFSEKAAAYSQGESHYRNAMIVVNACLSKYTEQEVKQAIDDKTILQLAKGCPPHGLDESKKFFIELGMDKIDLKDSIATNAFFIKNREAIAKHNQEIEEKASNSAQRLITVNHLAVDFMTPQQFKDMQEAALPVMRVFAQPKVISLRLGVMFAKLQKNLQEGVNIYDTVAELHCDYIDIHPKSGSTKRVARALMNLILISKGLQPVLFESDREKHAYYEAILQQIHYSLAGAKEKSLYNRLAFATLIRNKAEMTTPEFEAWIKQAYPHPQLERSFQVALNYFKTPQNFMNKLGRLNSNLPSNEFVCVPLQAGYARDRLARMLTHPPSIVGSIPQGRSSNAGEIAATSKRPANQETEKSASVNVTATKATSTTSAKSGKANFGGMRTGFFK